VGNKAAAPGNDRANPLQKKCGTLHETTAHHDHVGHEYGDQIGQTQTKIIGFALDGTLRPLIAIASQVADSLRGQSGTVRIIGRSISFQPTDHCRTSGQGFPASPKTAYAKRAGSIDDMMTNFRMGLVHSAVD